MPWAIESWTFGPPEDNRWYSQSTMHTIRLRQPWETHETAAGTMLVRRFNKPTGLDTGERVYLVIAATPELLSVRLNGELLETGSGFFSGNDDPSSTTLAEKKPDPFRCDITARLLPRNELSLDFAPGGSLGEVALQIAARA